MILYQYRTAPPRPFRWPGEADSFDRLLTVADLKNSLSAHD